MSLFGGPEEHAANPPETWEVVRVPYGASSVLWHLRTSATIGERFGHDHAATLESFSTRKAAEAAKVEGFYVDLYRKEARWYAGETPPGHRSWAECKAERERIEARRAELAAAGCDHYAVTDDGRVPCSCAVGRTHSLPGRDD